MAGIVRVVDALKARGIAPLACKTDEALNPTAATV
jgi:hypothetical protein